MTFHESSGQSDNLGARLKSALDDAWVLAPPSSVTIPTSRHRDHLLRGTSVTVLSVAAATAAVIVGGAVWTNSTSDDGRHGPANSGSFAPSLPRTPSTPSPPQTTIEECHPQPPGRLLDGSDPGPGRPANSAGTRYVWGQGAQSITQAVGQDELDLIGQKASQRIENPRWTAYLTLVGDEGVGEIAYAFRLGSCDYTVWLPAGTTMAQARDFVRDY